ncbi:MAG: DUF2177 family protein [Burkholderiaceae bacterium]|nr:DUF2177 family protein [Burkholderiaceae bacterium]
MSRNTPTAGRAALSFVVTAMAFLILDAVWLTVMADRLYRPGIGHVMREGFDVLAAATFYLVYISGVIFFAIAPAKRTVGALARGALFGFVAYATYDLTNQATVRDWPWHVTLVDLCWGPIVTSVSAAIGHRLAWRRSPASQSDQTAHQ